MGREIATAKQAILGLCDLACLFGETWAKIINSSSGLEHVRESAVSESTASLTQMTVQLAQLRAVLIAELHTASRSNGGDASYESLAESLEQK